MTKRIHSVVANLAYPVCGLDKAKIKVDSGYKHETIPNQLLELENQTIGFMDEPCEDCLKLTEQGEIVLGIDLAKTKDKFNPYRTGHKVLVKKGTFNEPYLFMDLKDMKERGLVK